MALDVEFSTFLKEKGYKNYVRTGLFRRKRAKTYDRASDSEKREYNAWKKKKTEEYNAAFNTSNLPDVDSLGFVDVERDKTLESLNKDIVYIDRVDLSDDIGNYFLENEIEQKYPELVELIYENVSDYASEFQVGEEYAQVIVTNTINNRVEILDHVRWMITPPTAPNDVELRNAEEMGTWVLQTTDDVGINELTPVIKENERTPLPKPKPTLRKPKRGLFGRPGNSTIEFRNNRNRNQGTTSFEPGSFTSVFFRDRL